MKELVIISGKGGTGKTSIAASFAVLADNAVMADCDVDAADLHLLLTPEIQRREIFRSGHEACIRAEDCDGCGLCAGLCRFAAIRTSQQPDGAIVFSVDPVACEGCGVCLRYCPRYAIDLEECECGEWFISRTRCGPMVHADLFAATENSGKLVSLVREQARIVATEQGRDMVLVDGSPGIGCPVIASLTGANLVLLVTEPTVSGLHDLERITQVTEHFRVPACVCVNKWDLNAQMTERIESWASERGLKTLGRIRYDRDVTRAQLEGRTLVEFTADGAAAEVSKLWRTVEKLLNTGATQPANNPDTAHISTADLRSIP